ncbi:MAG: hypothetical protein P1U85_00100 [Verrucomicrobiales bacterium]|nr:hypothetical protein [Verrucomicrobiales bacterium]
MFKRVALENWHEWVPYICFALVAGVFLVIVIRAICMKKSEIERISSLPLQDDETLLESINSDEETSHEQKD